MMKKIREGQTNKMNKIETKVMKINGKNEK